MHRPVVIAKLRASELALRAHGISALYLFSFNDCEPDCRRAGINVLVDASDEQFYALSNFMGAYAQLCDTFPGTEIGYATRDSLSRHLQPLAAQDAEQIF